MFETSRFRSLPSALVCLGLTMLVTNSVRAQLTAHFPLDGMAGQNTSTIDDVIDDASHPITDGTGNNGNASWFADATRGSVLLTPDGNYFSAGTQGINTNDGFTWSFWANVDSGESASHSVIGTRQGSWHKLTTASGVDGPGFADFASGDYDLRDDTWHHIGYVGDSSGARLYIDGMFIDEDTSLSSSMYNENFQIGGTPSFSETVNALMDDIGIWEEALTVDELTALYEISSSDGLLYDAGEFDVLKQLHDSSGSGTVDIDGIEWEFVASGLTPGLMSDGMGGYSLGLDAAAGSGVQTVSAAVPEPASIALWSLLGLALAGIGYFRRKR